MGFKNKLNKMKSFLFDDEEEKEVPKTVKKVNVKKEEVKEEPIVKENKIDFEDDYLSKKTNNDLYFEDVSDTYEKRSQEIKSRSQKNEREFNFPEFNDDDFLVTKKKEEVKEEPVVIPPKKEEPKVLLYQGSKRKEEIKKFKPSPFISPVYGLLDNQGNSVKKDEVDEIIKDKDEISIDDIRRKAYGNFDKEIEDTIRHLSSKTIEEAEEEYNYRNEYKVKEEVKPKSSVKEIKNVTKEVIVDDEDDDDMILPSVNFKEINVDSSSKVKNVKKEEDDEDDDDDTKEQDLFNLIDTMYSKGEKDDD